MSNLYVRVFTGFYAHRKTARLRAALGNDAYWIPPRIWSYAAENQPDGIFSDYKPEEIAILIGYNGDASSMLKALVTAGFLDESPLRIHDWREHNAYHETFSQRAKKASAARWAKSSPSAPSPNTETGKGKGVSIATSNASSILVLSPQQQRVEWNSELNRITNAMRSYASLNDYDPGSKQHKELSELLIRQKQLCEWLGAKR